MLWQLPTHSSQAFGYSMIAIDVVQIINGRDFKWELSSQLDLKIFKGRHCYDHISDRVEDNLFSNRAVLKLNV